MDKRFMVFGLPMLKGEVMQRKLGTRLLTLLLVLVAFGTACEKKRKSRFVQGDGEYVYAINDFKGATYTLKTGKKRTPGVTTRADELVVEPGSSVMRSFNSVEFELETDVGDFSSSTMNNFDFYGKEDSEYKVQVDFTEEKLVFFELTTKDQIPSNVITYAEEVGNGLYRVPLFGLPLDKVTVERIVDERGKSTNQIRTISKKFLSEATHFLVNVNTPAYFDAEMKLDMLPSKFFDENNQWFYEVTVVDKPIALGSGEELGMQMGSGKVRFAKTNNSVLAVDLNIADEAEGQDAEKLNVVFEIPVQWMDYRLVKTGDSAYLKEEAFDSIEQGAKFWKDREYALLNLDRVLSIDAASTNNIKIKRLEVGDDYFSFIIYDSLTKYSLHYSFAKKNEVVAGKVYPREDMRKFGFFSSFKELYSGQLNNSETTISKSLIQNRMLPPNNTVTFHITDNTPTDPIFIEAIQEAINGWNWAFGEAAKGTTSEANPIKVVLDTSKPVKNGDARYHKVSFYGYEVESGLLGYGPSVSDNRNGEIYSSTNHIYLRNYRESIIRNLVNYIRYRLGSYSGLDVDGITVPNQILAVQSNPGYDFGTPGAVASANGSVNMFAAFPGQAATDGIPAIDWEKVKNTDLATHVKALTSMSKAKNAQALQLRPGQSSILKSFMVGRKRMESGMSTEQDFNAYMKSAKEADVKTGQTCEMLAATSLTFKEIEDVCGSTGTEFADYVKELEGRVASGESIYRLDSEREVLLNCAQKLMKPTLIATLAHEFGHNFGLRHNFQGSADSANFARDAAGNPESRMASVMDYSHADADRGTRPAPYDIAAIRYGYYNSVEIVDKATGEHRVVDISAKDNKDLRPIEKRVADSQGAGVEIRKYAYCTDDDIAGYPDAQIGTETPFCERWDQGADPVTKVRSSIDTLVTSFVTSGNRFDMEGLASPVGLALSAVRNSLGGIRNVYDKYRFMLYNSSKGISAQAGQLQDDPYFDTTTEEATERLVLGEDAYTKANAFVAELRANPTMPAADVEKRIATFSEIAQYKIASEITKDFMIELVFGDANYCVALRSNGAGFEYLDAEPLATVRTKNFFLTGSDSSRCEDMTAYFAKKLSTTSNTAVAVDKVISVGNPYENVSFSSNPEILPLRNDLRTGNSSLRLIGLGYLAARTALGDAIFNAFTGDAYVSQEIGAGMTVASNADFHPSLLDGESFRTRYLAKLQARLVSGVNVSTLAGYADKKLKKTENKTVSVPQALSTRALPFYQEEKEFLNFAWMTFRQGVASPRAITSSKTASTTISSLPYDNFIGFGGDARYAEYLVSSDNTAYFTNGSAAVQLIRAFNDTDNALKAITQKTAIVKAGTAMQTRLNALDDKVSSVVSGYFVATTKLGDRYQTMNDVMYQVRICALNTLVKEFGLNANNYSSLLEQKAETARFSIPKYCEAARGDQETEMAAFEAQFTEQARAFLNYIKADKKLMTSSTVETILSSLGLPGAPDTAEDPATTLSRIFKGQSTLPLELVGYDFAGTQLTSLEYNTALSAIEKISTGLQSGNAATVPSIKASVQAARAEEFVRLQQDEPYVTLLNDKLELLRNLIFNN
ncbi:MAG: hypothetical protein EOP07_01670 [Proteobacteria bacterium]|nr:MAG: hypothetical protein EOP07_01670 [Pseudomonadota bacterium]